MFIPYLQVVIEPCHPLLFFSFMKKTTGVVDSAWIYKPFGSGYVMFIRVAEELSKESWSNPECI